MKILLTLFSLLILANSSQAEVIRLSEPVQSDEGSETFGAPIDTLPSMTTIIELLSKPETYEDKIFAVTATVKKVCQKKGCFFIAQQDNNVIRVAFKDYGFFVPTDIGNRSVTMIGELSRREISDSEAKHLSADLGEKGSIQSGILYEIIATSVRVI